MVFVDYTTPEQELISKFNAKKLNNIEKYSKVAKDSKTGHVCQRGISHNFQIKLNRYESDLKCRECGEMFIKHQEHLEYFKVGLDKYDPKRIRSQHSF